VKLTLKGNKKRIKSSQSVVWDDKWEIGRAEDLSATMRARL